MCAARGSIFFAIGCSVKWQIEKTVNRLETVMAHEVLAIAHLASTSRSLILLVLFVIHTADADVLKTSCKQVRCAGEGTKEAYMKVVARVTQLTRPSLVEHFCFLWCDACLAPMVGLDSL